MMDLQEFVTKTVVSIQCGISDINNQLSPTHDFKLGSSDTHGDNNSYKARIEFDVAIEAEQSSTAKKSGGVAIKVVSGNLGKEAGAKERNTSRIRFFVEQRQR